MKGFDMARGRSNFKICTVEMIILFLLEKKDLYGYQLSTMIGALSSGKFDVSESTLYPTLYKLLKNSTWKVSNISGSKSGNKDSATATGKQYIDGTGVHTMTRTVTLTCSPTGVFS